MKSVSLNGSSQYLTITPVAGLELSTFTVCIWFKKTSASGVYDIFNYMPKGAHADGRGYAMASHASNDRVSWGDNDGSWAVVNGPAPNTSWKSMMFTFNGTVGELLINNSVSGNVADGLGYTDGGGTNPNQKYCLIGAMYNAAFTNYFNGLITGLAIFNKVLDSTERAWIYNSGKVRDYRGAAFWSNCKLYLPFDGNFNDLSGQGNHATAVGSPTFSNDLP